MRRLIWWIGFTLIWCGVWVIDSGRPESGTRISAHAAPAVISIQPNSPNAVQLERITQVNYSPWDLVTALAWSQDGEKLAVAAGDNVSLVRTDDWSEIIRLPVGALTHSLMFSADGRWLAAGSRDGFLRIWEYSHLQQESDNHSPRLIQAHRKGVNSLMFNPDGMILATGGNDAIARFWDHLTGEMLGMTIGGSFAVPSIHFSPDGAVLAIVNGDLIRLREVGTERIIGTFKADAPLYRVVFSPDGERIAATASDNLIRLWETDQAFRTGKTAYPEPLLFIGHAGAPGTFRALVWESVFSPNGSLLVSAGGDATIRLWQPDTGALLATYPAHPPGVTCIAFRHDGELLASGGLDGSLIIWKLIY